MSNHSRDKTHPTGGMERMANQCSGLDSSDCESQIHVHTSHGYRLFSFRSVRGLEFWRTWVWVGGSDRVGGNIFMEVMGEREIQIFVFGGVFVVGSIICSGV